MCKGLCKAHTHTNVLCTQEELFALEKSTHTRGTLSFLPPPPLSPHKEISFTSHLCAVSTDRGREGGGRRGKKQKWRWGDGTNRGKEEMKEKREGGRETRDRTGQERPFKNVINQLLRPLPFFFDSKGWCC